MKKCTKCGEIKAISEFRAMAKSADGKRPNCGDCSRKEAAQYREKYKDRVKQQHLNWYAKYKTQIIEQHRCYRARNEEKIYQLHKRYRSKNDDKCKAANAEWRAANADYHRENARQWSKNNPARKRVHNSKRRGASMEATPPWANIDAMQSVYEMARSLALSTGIEHHVDHIVPLQHKIVCGLHCEHNLQAIPAVDNLRKNNRVWPDMPTGAEPLQPEFI